MTLASFETIGIHKFNDIKSMTLRSALCLVLSYLDFLYTDLRLSVSSWPMVLPLASPTFIHGLSSSSTFPFFPEALAQLIFIFLTPIVELKYGNPSRHLVSWQ